MLTRATGAGCLVTEDGTVGAQSQPSALLVALSGGTRDAAIAAHEAAAHRRIDIARLVTFSEDVDRAAGDRPVTYLGTPTVGRSSELRNGSA